MLCTIGILLVLLLLHLLCATTRTVRSTQCWVSPLLVVAQSLLLHTVNTKAARKSASCIICFSMFCIMFDAQLLSGVDLADTATTCFVFLSKCTLRFTLLGSSTKAALLFVSFSGCSEHVTAFLY